MILSWKSPKKLKIKFLRIKIKIVSKRVLNKFWIKNPKKVFLLLKIVIFNNRMIDSRKNLQIKLLKISTF